MLIKDGILVDPVREESVRRDILIEGKRIERILQPGELKNEVGIEVIDASGKIVVPGLVDMHVHLREPGYEYKETVATGAMAGAAGGFTGVACMPNTDPVNDVRAVTEFILGQARKADIIRVYPIAAISKGQMGETLTDFGDLRKAGAVGVSDDGFPVKNSELMRRALEYAKYHSLIVISHCEDLDLSAGGVMHEGAISTKIGLRGIPAASEEIFVQREILLSKLTGCPVHIAHVSTCGSVELIRRAKEKGIPVTAETAPHYFTLDHRSVEGYDTNAKMNPPLRRPEDVQAIRDGLSEDVIDVIATDHAPHSALEKELEFEKAAFGIIGLETAVPLTLALVRDGILTLPKAIGKLSRNPAGILGLDAGVVEEGGVADLSIIDTECEYVLKKAEIQSKSGNSPFIGKAMKGRNAITICGGRIVWYRQKEYSGR